MKYPESNYRGRLAPSPTGLLHLGHARTFWTAQERARAHGGTLLLRNDDLDTARCRPEFAAAMIEDMRWFGLDWQEPMVPQSERIPLYRAALARLHAAGLIFPCSRSRRDVLAAASAPHDGEENDEPLYPPEFRPAAGAPLPPLTDPIAVNWRFRVPDGEVLAFTDGRFGPQQTVAGRDFGDQRPHCADPLVGGRFRRRQRRLTAHGVEDAVAQLIPRLGPRNLAGHASAWIPLRPPAAALAPRPDRFAPWPHRPAWPPLLGTVARSGAASAVPDRPLR